MGVIINQTLSNLLASGESIKKKITQTAHGFSIGQWVYLNGTTYVLVDANSISSVNSVGVVTAVTTDTFDLTVDGYVSNLTGLTSGTKYYISTTAGTIPVDTKITFPN